MEEKKAPPLYVRVLSWVIRPFPDFDFSFIKPVLQANFFNNAWTRLRTVAVVGEVC